MLKRLLASLAIVSVVVAGAVAVLWWRAAHGHADAVLHVGTSSVYTGHDRLFVEQNQTAATGAIQTRIKPYEFGNVMGIATIAPCLWAAITLRRRLRPRPPGTDLATMGGRS